MPFLVGAAGVAGDVGPHVKRVISTTVVEGAFLTTRSGRTAIMLVILVGALTATPAQEAVGAPGAVAPPPPGALAPAAPPSPTPQAAEPAMHLALPPPSSSYLICRSGGNTIVGYKSYAGATFIVNVDPYVRPMGDGASPSILSPGQCGYLTFRGSQPQFHSLCFKTGSVQGFQWFPAAPSYSKLITDPAIVGGLMSGSGTYELVVHTEQNCLVVDSWAQ